MRAVAPKRNPVEWECCRMSTKTAASGIISLRTRLYNPSVTLYRVERSTSERPPCFSLRAHGIRADSAEARRIVSSSKMQREMCVKSVRKGNRY